MGYSDYNDWDEDDCDRDSSVTTAEREVRFDSKGQTNTQGLKITEKWRVH